MGVALFILFAISMPAMADQMRLTSDTLNYDPASGIIKASGNVRVLGKDTEMTSRQGEFDAGGKSSHLWEDVSANWSNGVRTIDCADLVITEEPGGQQITARAVKRFYDSVKKITMRSSLMKGSLGGGEIIELTATGSVVADAVAADGAPTRLTGEKAVYSKADDSMVFTGNPVATQKNRRITADKFIIHIASGRMEAIGNPQMVVDIPAGEGI